VKKKNSDWFRISYGLSKKVSHWTTEPSLAHGDVLVQVHKPRNLPIT